jgi:threonine dehydratase
MLTTPLPLPTLDQIDSAAAIIYRSMPATLQYRWPLLETRAGRELWVKHEDHTPVGAFKVRGALTYFDELSARGANIPGVICATRCARSARASSNAAPSGSSPTGGNVDAEVFAGILTLQARAHKLAQCKK